MLEDGARLRGESEPQGPGSDVNEAAKARRATSLVQSLQLFLIFLTLVLLFCQFYRTHSRFPFYFQWDMDQFAASESISLNSNLIPRAIFHPGFGMHLFNHIAHNTAHRIGLVSARDIHDLELSLNPTLVIAELTDFLRLVPPVLCISTIVFLWLSVVVAFRPDRTWSLFALLALGTLQSLVYQSAMIRFEMYSIFYWSVAVLFLAMACRCTNPIPFWSLIFCSGIALGLSFLTKIQVLSYLAAFPCLAVYLMFQPSHAPWQALKLDPRAAGALAALTAIGLGVFCALLAVAATTELPESILNFDFSLGLQVPAYGVLISVSGILAAQLFFIRNAPRYPNAYHLSAVATALFLGFLASFLTHFLIFRDPALSLRYLVYDTRMAFLLSTFYETRDFEYYRQTLVNNLGFSWLIFTILAISAGVFLLAALRPNAAVSRLTAFALFGSIFVALLTCTFGARFYLRDLVWTELLPAFVVLLALATAASSQRRTVAHFSYLLLAALTASNILGVLRMQDRLDANYNVYGWQMNPWFDAAWNNGEYLAVANLPSPTMRTAAFDAAKRHADTKRLLDYVFKNVRPDLRRAGVLSEGFPVWLGDRTRTVSRLPDPLRESVVFDPSNVDLADREFLTNVDAHYEHRQKFRERTGPSPAMSVLGRPDLKVYLFCEAEDRERVLQRHVEVVPSKLAIVIGDDHQRETRYVAVEIRNYCAVGLSAFTQRFFFIIQVLEGGTTPPLGLLPADADFSEF